MQGEDIECLWLYFPFINIEVIMFYFFYLSAGGPFINVIVQLVVI
mgnify:CR=1